MTVRSVLVTGATGFVGTHVMEALSTRVPEVRAIVRATSDTRSLRERGVALHTGRLDDAAFLREAVSGVDAVIHLAALTHARTESELARVNAGGTAAILDAAISAEHPARRFVYLSSLAAAGPSGARPVEVTDSPSPLTAYGRTKLAGETAVHDRAGEIETVILRAPAVYGPGDKELLRFFRMARMGVLPIPGGGDRPLQMIHVKDLARAVVEAAVAPELRGTFNVAEARAYGWRDVCRLVAKAVGRKPVFLPVPRAAIQAAANVSERFAGLTGKSTMFNREKVRELLAPGWLCETESTRKAFGFAAEIPLAEGLRGTAEWYRTSGWL